MNLFEHVSPSSLKAPGAICPSLLAVATLGAVVGLVSAPQHILIMTATLAVIPPAVTALRGRQLDLFEPVWLFAAFYLVGYGVKAAFVADDPATFSSYPSYSGGQGVQAEPLLASLGGLLSFLAGYFSGAFRPFARLIPDLGSARISGNRLRCGAIVGIVGSLVSLLALVLLSGAGVSQLSLFDSQTRRAILGELEGRGVFAILVPLMPLFSLAYLSTQFSRRGTLRCRASSLFVFIITTLAMALVGTRNALLGFYVGYLILRHLQYRRSRIGLQIGVMVAAAALASAFGASLNRQPSSATPPSGVLKNVLGTFDSFDHLSIAMATVDERLWGTTIVEDVTITFIPRALFRDKPNIYGVTRVQEHILPGVGASVGYGATFPPSILAEGYVNFGVAGVLMLPFLLGAVFRALRHRAVADGGGTIVLYAFLLGGVLSALRGFGSFVAGTVVAFGFAWLLFCASPSLPWRRPAHNPRQLRSP